MSWHPRIIPFAIGLVSNSTLAPMRYAVINAGGSGTRLWPLSRGGRPKQLLELPGGKSLLRLAYDRIAGVLPADRILVCTGTAQRDAVAAHLPELPVENILCEPLARDTSNAIGLASAVLAERDPDAVVAFLTSDHVIEPVDEFQRAIETGYRVAEAEASALVVFGIPPSSPHTGLGYIEQQQEEPTDPEGREAVQVTAFTEKPDADTARRYLAAGGYLWNAGTFVWRADTLLGQLRQHLTRSYEGVRRIAAAWETPERDQVLEQVYAELPKISIDYAVLEPAAKAGDVLVVPMAVDWLDVGSWPALARTMNTDDADNAHDAVTAFVDSEGNIVVSDDPDHLVATIGLHDTVVVHTRDVTMVCPKALAERVKDLAARVRETYGERYT